jgi:hypothetical protein
MNHQDFILSDDFKRGLDEVCSITSGCSRPAVAQSPAERGGG